MRVITIECDLCGEELELQRAKEVLFETGNNHYRLMDLCTGCLNTQLARAESVNDTPGKRQHAAALIRLPGREVPVPSSAKA